jgi:hypothetical protein
MIEHFYNIGIDNLTEQFGVYNKTSVRGGNPFNRNKQLKIMTMPIIICTFSENCIILLLAPSWIVELMCSVKMFPSCYIKYCNYSYLGNAKLHNE